MPYVVPVVSEQALQHAFVRDTAAILAAMPTAKRELLAFSERRRVVDRNQIAALVPAAQPAHDAGFSFEPSEGYGNHNALWIQATRLYRAGVVELEAGISLPRGAHQQRDGEV